MRASKIKEFILILSIAIITAFIYNNLSASGIDYINKKKKFSDDEILTVEQTKEIFDSKTAVFIDARPMFSYSRGHIPGALNVPYSSRTKEQLLKDVEKEENIVVYCYSSRCNQARILATELKKLDYKHVAVFNGGISEWQKAGHPVETAQSES